ncbi:Mediator of RNA polymerase II transcription subunit 9 [Madurella fahalii]|uniref:Mediator of RNA polymerase II transcription subunit 9 n=1 Tax=Madurella fahalii TaxID=1157608 RepID=A0ABQ0GID9_9PEZI
MATHQLPDGLSPDAVDTLTELTSIITKLRSAQQQASTAAGGAGVSSTVAPGTGATPLPPPLSHQPSGATPAPGAVTGTTPLPSAATPAATGGGGAGGSGGPLLSVKELPAATDNLKHKLQRARAAMRTLADVQRSIAAQETELVGLDGRRRKQAAMLARTQEDGLQFVRAEQRSRDEEGDRMVVE